MAVGEYGPRIGQVSGGDEVRIPAARPLIGKEEVEAVSRVVASGQLAQGDEVLAFEQEFSSAAVQGWECMAVNSGTSALHLSLLALSIGPGDEVLVPSFTFAATANSVALTGAKPVFVDIDADTFCISPADAERKITSRTRGIIPVHLYGLPANMPELCDIAETHRLFVIEDAAQAHLACINDRPVGTWGHIAAFSFYPTKNMTSGEGGMVVTCDPELARRVRLLRNQGQEIRYQNEIVGLNNRMTDIHAALGRVQLRRLPAWTESRIALAAHYSAALVGVTTPITPTGYTHVFHQYTIQVAASQREHLVSALSSRGIGCGVYYPNPVHTLKPYLTRDDLPSTQFAAASVLSLPVYPSLTASEQQEVIDAVNSTCGGTQ